MAKRSWSPASNVNRGHLVTMAARGDEEYVAFVADFFAAKRDSNVTRFEELINEGIEANYLTVDALEKITGSTTSAAAVAVAAQADAARQLIFSLLQSGMDDAVQSLIDNEEQPFVTEEAVATWKSQLEAAK